MPSRSSQKVVRFRAPRLVWTAALLTAVCLAGSSCSSGDSSSSSNTSAPKLAAGDSQSTPPTGSGASIGGINPTTPPPITATGASQVKVACREIYPAVIEVVSAWNNANSKDDAASLKKAADSLVEAAEGVDGVAKNSGDEQVIKLTAAVSVQLKKISADYKAEKDVNGAPLKAAADALWKHCQNT
ncbi:hypothetical protein [Austwickia chelonae]|uniref:hypothetical protein n=1 Tax=Austwickia chelonae TaxID=100225 RepID=UPI000E23198F|nr:hypothetical protein [Austwickia chelonae]